MHVGSLFAGIGGIDKGFIQAGFEVAWANEIDKKACITYRYNFHHEIIEKDVEKLGFGEVTSIDILCAGFPCQAFSVAGYQKGFTDSCGNVFFQILRFIDKLSPQVVFFRKCKKSILP